MQHCFEQNCRLISYGSKRIILCVINATKNIYCNSKNISIVKFFRVTSEHLSNKQKKQISLYCLLFLWLSQYCVMYKIVKNVGTCLKIVYKIKIFIQKIGSLITGGFLIFNHLNTGV